MNFLYLHAHLGHDLHAIAEGEDDAFLGCAHEVGLGVLVEVNAMEAGSGFFVLKHTLCTIAKGDDADALATDGNRRHDVVHLGIAHALGRHRTAHPGIENAGAVDAQQHTQPCEQ